MGAATRVSLDRASCFEEEKWGGSGEGTRCGCRNGSAPTRRGSGAIMARIKEGLGCGERSTIAPKLHKKPRCRRAEHVYGVWGRIQLASECLDLDHTYLVLEYKAVVHEVFLSLAEVGPSDRRIASCIKHHDQCDQSTPHSPGQCTLRYTASPPNKRDCASPNSPLSTDRPASFFPGPRSTHRFGVTTHAHRLTPPPNHAARRPGRRPTARLTCRPAYSRPTRGRRRRVSRALWLPSYHPGRTVSRRQRRCSRARGARSRPRPARGTVR